ncbi:MAG: response regulator, partial [Litorimonas sp.]
EQAPAPIQVAEPVAIAQPAVAQPPVAQPSAAQPPAAPEVAAPPAAVQPAVAAPVNNVAEIDPHGRAADQAHAAREDERDFERRALPIENDEAVLGNNWRDAVIAKAIGGEDSLLPGMTSDPEPSATSEAKPDAIRILLAEDNAINALLTRTLLEADGHTVDTVEDGALAVEAMKAKEYDMIFMDMRMPNMDGLESTRKIRALPNVSRDLPIVALTANAFDDDRNACFDSGMNDFMTKPVSAEELSEMVIRWTADRDQKMAS